MSAPNGGMQQLAALSRDFYNGVSVAANNASQVDKAGQWGIDGWIRVFHDLIDLQIRTFASVVQGGISGPWWRETPDDVLPPEPVKVAPRPYPRVIATYEFVRVGRPDVTIPPASLSIDKALPANAEQFSVTLRDDRYLGSNYEAEFTLTNPANGRTDCTFKAIVGL